MHGYAADKPRAERPTLPRPRLLDELEVELGRTECVRVDDTRRPYERSASAGKSLYGTTTTGRKEKSAVHVEIRSR